MEGQGVCKTLPDHLVERIIAMTPFPAIFQARCLSKSWRARFSSVASQDDEQMKCIASSFQKLVRERSMNWGTFSPVFISTNGDLVAYDKKTNNWRELPSVSFLPKFFSLTGFRFDLQIEGALLYAFGYSDDLYVANILTRAWKHLPRPPISGRVLTSKLLVSDEESYEVILFCQRDLYPTDLVFVQIYDSKSGSWSSITADLKLSYDPDTDGVCFNSVYFDGNLYIAGLYMEVFVFNVRHGTFEQLTLRSSGRADTDWELDWEQYTQLVVCEDELLMVMLGERCRTPSMVMRIDLNSLTLIPLSCGFPSPGALEASSRGMPPAGDEEHIFFVCVEDRSSRMRAYNVKADLWSSTFIIPTFSEEFPFKKSEYHWIASFRPGFGPFVAV